MKERINVTLFHMKLCDHCIRFMPIWNAIREESEPYNIFTFDAHEYGTFGSLNHKQRSICGKPVELFPTIKFDILGDEYKYDGKRTNIDIYRDILAKLRRSLGK